MKSKCAECGTSEGTPAVEIQLGKTIHRFCQDDCYRKWTDQHIADPRVASLVEASEKMRQTKAGA